MDEHFRLSPLASNMPALMACCRSGTITFLGARRSRVLPYDQYMKRFPAYLQQLTMESNGKHVTLEGLPVRESTSPIVGVSKGPTVSISFYQLLHQAHAWSPATSSAFASR